MTPRVAWKWGRRLLGAPVRELLRPLVRLVPRDPGLVVFGVAGDRFGDNPAYLYLRLVSESGGVRARWVTGSNRVASRLRALGLPVVSRHSPRGILTCLRAGWWVVGSYPSDISRWWYDGATVLNLWHGVGPKAIERQLRTGPLARIHRPRPWWSPVRAAVRDETHRPDYVVSTSTAATRQVFAPAFDLPEAACLQVGYPRTDHFFDSELAAPPGLVASAETWAEARCSKRPLVGYFPTFRDDQRDFLADAGVALPDLAALVADAGGRLLYKPHFHAASRAWPTSADALLLDADDDVNAYLPLCSIVVTDFSSVASDFLLLDRPVLFFAPDYDRFVATRELAFAPDAVMPGPKVRSVTELRDALVGMLRHPELDTWGPARRAARRLLWDDYDGGAAQALIALLAAGTRAPRTQASAMAEAVA